MKEVLKYYKDFPKEGIIFVDIIPFLQNKAVFKQLQKALPYSKTVIRNQPTVV